MHVHGWLGEFSPEQARTRMFIGVAVRHAPRGIFAAPNFPDAARDVATFPEHVAVENVRSLMNYGCARPAFAAPHLPRMPSAVLSFHAHGSELGVPSPEHLFFGSQFGLVSIVSIVSTGHNGVLVIDIHGVLH